MDVHGLLVVELFNGGPNGPLALVHGLDFHSRCKLEVYIKYTVSSTQFRAPPLFSSGQVFLFVDGKVGPNGSRPRACWSTCGCIFPGINFLFRSVFQMLR